MRKLSAIILLALLAGCGTQNDAGSTLESGQRDLRPPVVATVDHPDKPVTLTIGDDSAPTDPIATDTAGVLLPPQDVNRLGWWADSSLPGSGAGTVLITGHVDDVVQG
ncbi:class F sortase, partial [Nocardia sp. NPDC058497]